MDGERSRLPAGREGGYVPPDWVSTQQFWAIPAGGKQSAAQPESAWSNAADRRVAPADDDIDTPHFTTDARPLPIAAAAPPRLPSAPSPASPAPAGPAPAGPAYGGSAYGGPAYGGSAHGGPAYGGSGYQGRRVAGSVSEVTAPGRALGQAGSIHLAGPPPEPAGPAAGPAPAPAAPQTSPPGSVRRSRHGRHMAAAAATAVGVVVIGAGVAALWPGGAPKPAASGERPSSSSPSSSAPAKTQRGAPSPTGSAASGGATTAPAAAAGQPLTQGRVVSYTTAQREPGYFEGVLTLTNRTGAPLSAWQVSFTYPGAYIKTVWGGVLVQAGSAATIRGTGAAASIPAGGTVQVRFGASGTPSAPRGCTLNGGPC